MPSVVRGSFAEAIHRARRTWPGTMEEFTTEVSEDMVDNIQRHTPVDTGRLVGSIRRLPTRRTGPRTWQGGARTDVEYASFVEDDTRPHRITAQDAPMLVFWKNGRKIVTKTVRHPGTSGQHMFLKGSEDTEARLGGLMERKLRTWSRRAGL